MELCDFIDESTLPAECKSFIRNPTSLIGRKVKQRFLDEVGGTTTCSVYLRPGSDCQARARLTATYRLFAVN